MGDAKLEEESGECILGGGYARVVDEPSDCNVYLTKNRMLRCSKRTHAGDEITRCAQEVDSLEYLENLDRVALSMVTCETGRIGLVFQQGDPRSLIHFFEVVETPRELHVLVLL